jgi:hypothetical protein
MFSNYLLCGISILLRKGAAIDESYTDGFTGDELADHIGTREPSRKADNPAPAKDSSDTPR